MPDEQPNYSLKDLAAVHNSRVLDFIDALDTEQVLMRRLFRLAELAVENDDTEEIERVSVLLDRCPSVTDLMAGPSELQILQS